MLSFAVKSGDISFVFVGDVRGDGRGGKMSQFIGWRLAAGGWRLAGDTGQSAGSKQLMSTNSVS